MQEQEQEPVNAYLRGRGAQYNPKNRFTKHEVVREHVEGIDDWTEPNPATQYIEQEANLPPGR